MPESLSSLPVAIQITLGSGYMAYVVAYGGVRQHHSATDATFGTFAFGLVATAVLAWLPLIAGWRAAAAVALTIAAGALWKAVGIRFARWLLRITNVSWADDVPSAWLTITAERTNLRPSQIAVDVEGGRVLLCEDTRLFSDLPYGPCTLGLDGSIAMYVSAEMKPDGEWIDKTDINHAGEGAKITYIPAAGVKRVEMRYWSSVNGSDGLAARAAEKGAEAEPGV